MRARANDSSYERRASDRKDRSTSTMQVIKTEASEDRRETMVFRHVLAPLAKSFALES